MTQTDTGAPGAADGGGGASPPPWYVTANNAGDVIFVCTEGALLIAELLGSVDARKANARLIVNAANSNPALVAENARLRAAFEEVKELVLARPFDDEHTIFAITSIVGTALSEAVADE